MMFVLCGAMPVSALITVNYPVSVGITTLQPMQILSVSEGDGYNNTTGIYYHCDLISGDQIQIALYDSNGQLMSWANDDWQAPNSGSWSKSDVSLPANVRSVVLTLITSSYNGQRCAYFTEVDSTVNHILVPPYTT